MKSPANISPAVDAADLPNGTLVSFHCADGKSYWMRTPLVSDFPQPCLRAWIDPGAGEWVVPCFARLDGIIGEVVGMKSYRWRIRQSLAIRRESRARSINGFHAALAEMEKAHRAVVDSASSPMQADYKLKAFAVDSSMIDVFGKQGMPRSFAQFIKKLMPLVYFGALWHLRKRRDGQCEVGETCCAYMCGGAHYAAMSSFLNLRMAAQYPGWKSAGIRYTPKIVANILGEFSDELELTLPRGVRNSAL